MMTSAEYRRAHARLDEIERRSRLEPVGENEATAPRLSVVINGQVRLEFFPESRHGAKPRLAAALRTSARGPFVLRVDVS